jgi:hypothetical protein
MPQALKFSVVIVAMLAPRCSAIAVPPPADSTPSGIYRADRGHLWNRVYDAFYVRSGPDGVVYGRDRIEPLLWTGSKILLDDPSADRAATVLEEFLRVQGETLIENPLQRAMLQRDLWLVFNWLEYVKPEDQNFAEPKLTPETVEKGRQRLLPLLARAIRRLSLTAEQITQLPDNYAAAAGSKLFADRFDAEQAERPYLPPDLFAADGPWVCVGRSDGETAPRHLQEGSGNRFTNSVFLVFIRLPAGRDATLRYLRQLTEFDQPLLVPNDDKIMRRSDPFLPNGKLPQFPQGTETALVRRAMLVDSSCQVVGSHLVESVQLRVQRTDPAAPTPDAFNTASEIVRRRAGTQAFFEFRVLRQGLFAGDAGGLRDASAERDFKTGFSSHPQDWFELPRAANPESFLRLSRPEPNNRSTCIACHPFPGVFSFNSYQFFRIVNNRDGQQPKPHPLKVMTIDEVEQAAVKWKESQPGWAALRKLLVE